MLKIVSDASNEVKKEKSNNAGSSIILVVMTIAFVGMLVAVVVYMSYYNYLMKYGERSAKENFYTVENALDEINMGLQREISYAMAESYESSSKLSDKTVVEKEELFKDGMKKKLQERLRISAVDTTHYDVKKLILFLDKTRYNKTTGIGATILTTDTDAVLQVEDDKITLKDVYVQYKDKRGYVSMVKTDIVLGFPDISFVSNKIVPDLEEYSLIADIRLRTESSTRTEIEGNVYGGYEGIFSSNFSELVFKPNASTQRSLVVADKVVAENGSDTINSIVTADGTQLWTGGIEVNSANISLESDTYVADDLTIEGRNSNIVLKGKYYGYGNGYNSAATSSSILVNGAKTKLDMSGLQGLMLMGHAYVGAQHYNANTGSATDYVEDVSTISANSTDNFPLNGDDFVLGQSMAVKSDQLMYMVPTECMGYEGDTQVLAKNPLSLSEYNMLSKTVKLDSNGNPVTDAAGNQILRYSIVRLDKISSKLGKSVNTYGVTYQPVFRKVNGSILVYYYMYFNSESMANKFFRDYYTADKDAIDAYIKEYIADFKWNNNLGVRESNGTVANALHLAGNVISFDNTGKAYLKEDTTAEDAGSIAEINASIEDFANKYYALSKKLLLDKSNLAAEELSRTVFENVVVDDVAFAAVVPSGSEKLFTNATGGSTATIKAIVVNNKGGSVFELNDTKARDMYLLIATGDVRVTASEYDGLIIAGGNVDISPNCTRISADAENVLKAMNCMDASGTYYAADVLRDRNSYLNYTSTSNDQELVDENGYIRVNKLIHYENWKKE